MSRTRLQPRTHGASPGARLYSSPCARQTTGPPSRLCWIGTTERQQLWRMRVSCFVSQFQMKGRTGPPPQIFIVSVCRMEEDLHTSGFSYIQKRVTKLGGGGLKMPPWNLHVGCQIHAHELLCGLDKLASSGKVRCCMGTCCFCASSSC